MQLMGDALAVMGSRIGIAIEPKKRTCYLVRHGMHPGKAMEIHAGVKLNGRVMVLPLSNGEETFGFLDQGMTPTTMTLAGIDAETGIHIKLTVTVPFRPRDMEFSTIPAIFIKMEIERMPTRFRWEGLVNGDVEGELFLGFSGEGFNFSKDGMDMWVSYSSDVVTPGPSREIRYTRSVDLQDKIVNCSPGTWVGNRIVRKFSLDKGIKGPDITAAWCVYDEPVLNVLGDMCKFKYTKQFKNVDEVADWSRENIKNVESNSQRVDKIIEGHNLGNSVNCLMAQTLHTWLMNTWCVIRSGDHEWFTVWEGNCYYHSTVDVEYTQTPFYLTLWPELLEMQLNEWPFYGQDGVKALGDRGKGTLYLSHDMGKYADCTRQYYGHPMEVEESSNYLLMAFVHWRRTGKDTIIKKHSGFMERLLNFIILSDTTGNCIPDKGNANTIDDATPAIQFGAEQVYLGVKAMAACLVGKIMLEYAGRHNLGIYDVFVKTSRKTLETEGWKDDHFVVTLTRTLEGVLNPRTNEFMSGELEGWDGYHIYTQNGLALLDMIGFDTGISRELLKKDIESSLPKTLGKYGCRHSSYVTDNTEDIFVEGASANAPKVGWISMNMLRDIAAAYRGIDCMTMADRYWQWQCTTNTQQIALFFETFYGNNLHFYPRGVAVFGYLDAAAGFSYDAVTGKKNLSPVRASITVPLLIFADWKNGTVQKVKTEMNKGKIIYKVLEA